LKEKKHANWMKNNNSIYLPEWEDMQNFGVGATFNPPFPIN
jgi:hypothetical protein